MSKKICVVMCMLVVLIGTFGKCHPEENIPAKDSYISELLSSLDKPINYFGKVVDLNGQPVSDAEVSIQINQADGVKEIKLTADSAGYFIVTGTTGSRLLIVDITTEGYEFLNSNRQDGHNGFENDGSVALSKEVPVVFTMRKKEPPTTVIPGDISIELAKDEQIYEVDLVEMVAGMTGYLKRYHSDSAHADLTLQRKCILAENACTIYFTVPDSGSGIIASDEILYVPYETGYQRSYALKISNGSAVKKHLYIKSRSGGLYSRMDTRISFESGIIGISAQAWTNPLGQRNLDFDEDRYEAYLIQKKASVEKMNSISR